ncbi:MAG: hypothetical protein V9E85_07825 [Candidatus Nanopelagicales bacterium]
MSPPDVGVCTYAPVKRMQTMAGIMMLKRVAGSVLVVCALGLAGCSTPAGAPSGAATVTGVPAASATATEGT